MNDWREAIIRTKAKLLILDPIQAYLGGSMDMNRANEARDMTKKLAALAEKYQCAIVLVGHMNKAAGNKAAYRGMGSIDFFAVARSVLLVGRVEGEENIRAVVQIKNNLAGFGHPKAFQLSEDGFLWLGDYEITADEVFRWHLLQKRINWNRQSVCSGNLQKQTMLYRAMRFLILRRNRIYPDGTLENAKKELGVRAKRINNSWYWN